MSESKVVRYGLDSFDGLVPRAEGGYVTHADYKELENELAALRGKVAPLLFAAGQAYGCTAGMDDAERDRVLGQHVRGPLEAFL